MTKIFKRLTFVITIFPIIFIWSLVLAAAVLFYFAPLWIYGNEIEEHLCEFVCFGEKHLNAYEGLLLYD